MPSRFDSPPVFFFHHPLKFFYALMVGGLAFFFPFWTVFPFPLLPQLSAFWMHPVCNDMNMLMTSVIMNRNDRLIILQIHMLNKVLANRKHLLVGRIIFLGPTIRNMVCWGFNFMVIRSVLVGKF